MNATQESDTTFIPPLPQKRTSSLQMICALGGVALMSGLLIVLVDQVTRAGIERNHREAVQKAVGAVLPAEPASRVIYGFDEDQGFFELTEAEARTYDLPLYYAGYNEEGELLGVAIQGMAQGYADMVTLMYGYDPDTETLTGMTVLASKETPGLGSRIGEPDFRRSLVDLDLGLSAEDQGLEHPVIAAKPGEAEAPWAFEAITGATISSNAVAAAITQSAEEALPKIQAHLDQIKRKGE